MSNNNNPLRQYFRRPAVYLKLPSCGKGYLPDQVDFPENGEIPVYPMTAIDEITARTPDALFNGIAVAELVKSCVPSIKDPWQIQSIDLDAVLIAIKAASTPAGTDIESKCPKCEEEATYGINLIGLLASLTPGDYDTVLDVGELKVKFKPLRYKEINEAAISQFEIQKTFASLERVTDEEEKLKLSKQALEKITILTMEITSKTIEYIETPALRVDNYEFVLDFLKNCDRNQFAAIRDHNTKLKASSDIKPIDIKCVKCSHEYTQVFTLNPSDFFG